MNKKVGLITLHRTTNYGSVLQAYALQKTIIKLGYECKIIDYRPNRSTMTSMLKNLKYKNKILRSSLLIRIIVRIIILPSYILRFKTFHKFIKKNLNLTSEIFVNEEDFDKNKLDFDIYCTGSDQVWNSEWNNKIDKSLFLNFAPNNKNKIAYASSFGKEKLESWEKYDTQKLLERYSAISVRELSAINILNDLQIKNVSHVLDPTLLITNDEWYKITIDKFENKKYILVYNLNRNTKIYKYAESLSKKFKIPVKYITYQLHDVFKYGKMYCNVSVEKYLSLFKNATFVITDSFHGTAFSINFNKEFAIIYPNKFNTRLKSILKLTKLECRVVKSIDNFEIFNQKINYNDVNKIIENERNKSISWLEKKLKNNYKCDNFNTKKSVDIKNKCDCFGCRNCENICPSKAITMKKDSEGFLYPQINNSKCINCGKCKLVCPMINVKLSNVSVPDCYAVSNNDDKILLKSTSGGFFYSLAKYVIENHGNVYGAAFNKNLQLKHICIKKKDDISKLMGSKYLYSDLSNVFLDIKKKLNDGEIVLFTGVPCQIAALNNFLNKKYNNLITMDIICHGTPNQTLFNKYIIYLENKYNSRIIDYKFRSKEKSYWGTYKARIKLNNGKYKNINADFDKYYSAFLNSENYRESCYKCKFASKKRISDFTVGDFWGIEKIDEKFNKKNGVSCVIVNSEKAKKIFDTINADFDYIKVGYDEIYCNNKQLNNPPIRPKNRDTWYNDFNNQNFIKNIHIKKSYKNILKLFVPSKFKFQLKSIIRKK